LVIVDSLVISAWTLVIPNKNAEDRSEYRLTASAFLRPFFKKRYPYSLCSSRRRPGGSQVLL
jgi:hypothetical protein